MRFVLVAALLAGCAASPEPPHAGDVQVVWMRVEDPQRACEALSGRKQFFAVHGCARWSAAERRCEIYAPEPRSERDLQRFATLGHELMHCFDANWHDKWGRMDRPKYAVRRVDPQSEQASRQ